MDEQQAALQRIEQLRAQAHACVSDDPLTSVCAKAMDLLAVLAQPDPDPVNLSNALRALRNDEEMSFRFEEYEGNAPVAGARRLTYGVLESLHLAVGQLTNRALNSMRAPTVTQPAAASEQMRNPPPAPSSTSVWQPTEKPRRDNIKLENIITVTEPAAELNQNRIPPPSPSSTAVWQPTEKPRRDNIMLENITTVNEPAAELNQNRIPPPAPSSTVVWQPPEKPQSNNIKEENGCEKGVSHVSSTTQSYPAPIFEKPANGTHQPATAATAPIPANNESLEEQAGMDDEDDLTVLKVIQPMKGKSKKKRPQQDSCIADEVELMDYAASPIPLGAEGIDGDDEFDMPVQVAVNHMPLIPDQFDSVTKATDQFAKVFEARYGVDCNGSQVGTPNFFASSLEGAVREAFECPGRSTSARRPLALYIHHDGSIASNIFPAKLLCSNESLANVAVHELREHFIVWPWDVTLKSNEETLKTWMIKSELQLTEAHSLVQAALKDDVNRFPLLILIAKVDGAIKIVDHANAATSQCDLMQMLRRCIRASSRVPMAIGDYSLNDTARVIAEMSEEDRAEILADMDDSVLETLPSFIQEEAMALRDARAVQAAYDEDDVAGPSTSTRQPKKAPGRKPAARKKKYEDDDEEWNGETVAKKGKKTPARKATNQGDDEPGTSAASAPKEKKTPARKATKDEDEPCTSAASALKEKKTLERKSNTQGDDQPSTSTASAPKEKKGTNQGEDEPGTSTASAPKKKAPTRRSTRNKADEPSTSAASAPASTPTPAAYHQGNENDDTDDDDGTPSKKSK